MLLDKARSVARRSSHDLKNFDVGTADEPFIITDAVMQILEISGALTCCNHCTFFGFDILAFNFAKSDLLIW